MTRHSSMFARWPRTTNALIAIACVAVLWMMRDATRPPERDSIRSVLAHGLWNASDSRAPAHLSDDKWVLMYVASSACTDACGGALKGLRAIVDKLGQSPRLQAVVILSDGEINPDRTRSFAERVDPRVDVVTGRREDLARATNMLAAYTTPSGESSGDGLAFPSKALFLLDPGSRNIFVLSTDSDPGWIADIVTSHLKTRVNRIGNAPAWPL